MLGNHSNTPTWLQCDVRLKNLTFDSQAKWNQHDHRILCCFPLQYGFISTSLHELNKSLQYMSKKMRIPKTKGKRIHELMGLKRWRRRNWAYLASLMNSSLNCTWIWFYEATMKMGILFSLFGHHFSKKRIREGVERKWDEKEMWSVRDLNMEMGLSPFNKTRFKISEINVLNTKLRRKHRSEFDKNGFESEYDDLCKKIYFRLLNTSRWWH